MAEDRRCLRASGLLSGHAFGRLGCFAAGLLRVGNNSALGSHIFRRMGP